MPGNFCTEQATPGGNEQAMLLRDHVKAASVISPGIDYSKKLSLNLNK
jgi:hypothetical protein